MSTIHGPVRQVHATVLRSQLCNEVYAMAALPVHRLSLPTPPTHKQPVTSIPQLSYALSSMRNPHLQHNHPVLAYALVIRVCTRNTLASPPAAPRPLLLPAPTTVRALLRHGADIESAISASKVENSPIRCAVGSNALHIAALTGNIIMAKLILETQVRTVCTNAVRIVCDTRNWTVSSLHSSTGSIAGWCARRIRVQGGAWWPLVGNSMSCRRLVPSVLGTAAGASRIGRSAAHLRHGANQRYGSVDYKHPNTIIRASF